MIARVAMAAPIELAVKGFPVGAGEGIGGPAPFARADRSRFLSALDEALVRLKRG